MSLTNNRKKSVRTNRSNSTIDRLFLSQNVEQRSSENALEQTKSWHIKARRNVSSAYIIVDWCFHIGKCSDNAMIIHVPSIDLIKWPSERETFRDIASFTSYTSMFSSSLSSHVSIRHGMNQIISEWFLNGNTTADVIEMLAILSRFSSSNHTDRYTFDIFSICFNFILCSFKQ